MPIESFRYFYKVAVSKSISKVANEVHISQPALSQQIQKLEENLGYKLLTRSNKGVELTDKGLIVFKYVDNIVRTYDAMIQHLEQDSKEKQIIKIEACGPIATYALPCVLYKIKNKFPHHNYELKSNSSDKIENNIKNNIADIGVIYEKPTDQSLEYCEIDTDNLSLVAGYDYEIDEEISLKKLLKHPFILLSDKLDIEDRLVDNINSSGYEYNELNVLYKSDSIESVKASLFQGYGIAFLPYTSIKKELYEKRLKLVKISDFQIKYKMYLINDKRTQLNKAVNEFLDYFKEIGKKSMC
ncbi:LysR family transcriptional regulator [Clostridium sp. DL1XJH146]